MENETVYEIWKNDLDKPTREAGYTFISDGTWYAKGTEAVLLFNITVGTDDKTNGEGKSALQTVEDYVESGDTNYSGLFGGNRDSSVCRDTDMRQEPDWDEEGCGYNEFDIYKNGILVKEATEK
jgi:hypothetical protein